MYPMIAPIKAKGRKLGLNNATQQSIPNTTDKIPDSLKKFILIKHC